MLDRVVAVELVPDTIHKVVRPYMREHNLSEDKMLYQYIGVSCNRRELLVQSMLIAVWLNVVRCRIYYC